MPSISSVASRSAPSMFHPQPDPPCRTARLVLPNRAIRQRRTRARGDECGLARQATARSRFRRPSTGGPLREDCRCRSRPREPTSPAGLRTGTTRTTGLGSTDWPVNSADPRPSPTTTSTKEGALLSKSGHYIGIDGESTLLGMKSGVRDCVVAGSYRSSSRRRRRPAPRRPAWPTSTSGRQVGVFVADVSPTGCSESKEQAGYRHSMIPLVLIHGDTGRAGTLSP
jgi:hypothetical protein